MAKYKYRVTQKPGHRVGISHDDDYPTSMIVLDHKEWLELILFMNDEDVIKSIFSYCENQDILQTIESRIDVSF